VSVRVSLGLCQVTQRLQIKRNYPRRKVAVRWRGPISLVCLDSIEPFSSVVRSFSGRFHWQPEHKQVTQRRSVDSRVNKRRYFAHRTDVQRIETAAAILIHVDDRARRFDAVGDSKSRRT
jgi:hypothetical protein